MHELSIAENIIALVREHVPEEDRTAIRSVRLRIGPYSGVVPESLAFGFSVLAAGCEFSGAVLDIEQTPIVLACRQCRAHATVEYGSFQCPHCESSDTRVVSGAELHLVDIEICCVEEHGHVDAARPLPVL